MLRPITTRMGKIAVFVLLQIGHAGFGFKSGLMIDLRGKISFNHMQRTGPGLAPHLLESEAGCNRDWGDRSESEELHLQVASPGRHHDAQQLIFHFDGPGCGERLLPCLSKDGGNRVTDGTDLRIAEDRAIGHDVLQPVCSLDVFPRHDPDDPRHLLGCRRVNRLDQGVGMRAVDRGELSRSRHINVCRVLRNTTGLDHRRGPGMTDPDQALTRIRPHLVRSSLTSQKSPG